MCKGSSTVRWLPHFLVSAAAGPACALSWWRWILTLDAFGQSLTDWIWLVQAQWQINCTWSVAETIIRPGESGLDSARLSSTDLASVNDDNDANQIWHDHDMIWHDQLVQLKVHRLCCSHLGNTLLTSLDIWHLLTHRNRWMWSRCSTHGTESRWAHWTIVIHRHRPTPLELLNRCAAMFSAEHLLSRGGSHALECWQGGQARWRQNETNIWRTSTKIMNIWLYITSYNNLQ